MKYLSNDKMIFGMPGRRVSDEQWEIATGVRCANCKALRDDDHICVEKTAPNGGVIHTEDMGDLPYTLGEDVPDGS